MEAQAIERPKLIFDAAELLELTGYSQPARQLANLHERGFFRAHLDRGGRVVLERAHYEAVCAGRVDSARPKVRPPKVRPA